MDLSYKNRRGPIYNPQVSKPKLKPELTRTAWGYFYQTSSLMIGATEWAVLVRELAKWGIKME